MDLASGKCILNDLIGKTIKITTTNRCFQGILFSVHADRTVTLIKVKDLKTGEAVRGPRLFFGPNILNVEPVEESKSVGQEVEGETSEERSRLLSLKFAHSNHPEEPSNILWAIKCAVDNEEVVYTVIDQFQAAFQPTILHLKSQKVISLGAAGLNLGRYGKLCWLQVATRKHVYLFDILTMGPGVFKNGLQVVLEDKGILKVIHDGRWLVDILSHQYSVILNNVFDTQVGDVYLFSMETGGFLPHRTSSVKECLTRYLNMPATQVNFLNIKQTLMKEIPNIWSDRPMSSTLLKVLALEVLHLLDLRQAMLDDMFADVTLLVNSYLGAHCPRRADVLERVETPCSQLPKELQQLPVLQQMRRESALKEYNFNSQGFLIRAEKKKP
ncbi:piRNA biogenesis protein EXD1 [Rana temporaria]|uniref:piRNA biogenesis protein EXD1 n=1 Tax=Rana temporaria TaxID=8407 RepID=UPI001AADF92F|nr:piRNA biogenesis protein EXD1 [Rana temporaria]